MKPTLADRVSRALVRCYPRRWKRRYAAEVLDVLDQHPARPRTVLSLASGALSTHLDPSYRSGPRLSRDTLRITAIFAAVTVGLSAAVLAPAIAQTIRESSWHLSNDGSVAAVAFSRDQHLMVSTADGPPWSATATLWDITSQARPRRLSEFEGGAPVTISPDGRTVATGDFGGQPALWNVTRPRHPARMVILPTRFPGALWGAAFSPDGTILATASVSRLFLWDVADPARPHLLRTLAAPVVVRGPSPVPFSMGNGDLVFSPEGHLLASASGRGQVSLWDVTRPAQATRIATLAGLGDYFTALAFSPRGNLLAGVTYHGSVLVYRVTDPSRPVRVTTQPGALASARLPGGGRGPSGLCDQTCLIAAYALAFTPDGHVLTAVADRVSTGSIPAGRDTVFTWQVASSGALHGLTTMFRNVSDAQPTLAPGGRVVADGSSTGGGVRLWALPAPQSGQVGRQGLEP